MLSPFPPALVSPSGGRGLTRSRGNHRQPFHLPGPSLTVLGDGSSWSPLCPAPHAQLAGSRGCRGRTAGCPAPAAPSGPCGPSAPPSTGHRPAQLQVIPVRPARPPVNAAAVAGNAGGELAGDPVRQRCLAALPGTAGQPVPVLRVPGVGQPVPETLRAVHCSTPSPGVRASRFAARAFTASRSGAVNGSMLSVQATRPHPSGQEAT